MKKLTVYSFLFIVALALGCTRAQGPQKSIENLKAAIKGETTASAKYAEFAKKAKSENLARVALLFEAASKAESIHAKNHTDELVKLGAKMDPITPQFAVKSTKENIAAAIEGETYEVTTMYPDFLKAAQDEKAAGAERTFDFALQVEKVHKDLYTDALAKVNAGAVNTLSAIYTVCPVCGNTFNSSGPDVCPICGAAQSTFITVR